MEMEMIPRVLKSLADPTRLHIVQYLASMCCGQACVNEYGGLEGATAGQVCCHITGAEKITSTVSHHLHDLESVGLIQIERSGKSMICTLRPERMRQVADHLNELAQSAERRTCC